MLIAPHERRRREKENKETNAKKGLSLRAFARLGSGLSSFGTLSFKGELSVLDVVTFGSSLALRSYTRLGSALSVRA